MGRGSLFHEENRGETVVDDPVGERGAAVDVQC